MRHVRIVLLAAATLAALPAPGHAAVSGCIALTDPAGDQRVGFAGRSTPAPQDSALDITGLAWTKHQSYDGEEQYLTATLTVPDLKEAAPFGSLGVVYRLFYTTDDDVERYLEADWSTLFGGPTFYYGHFDDTGLVSDGDWSGDWVDGPGGSLTTEVPMADPDSTVHGIRWNASADEGAVIAQADVVPDTGAATYTGSRCTPVIDAPEDDGEDF